MNKPYLLQKLAPLGVGAFGALSVIGIATAPAQASTLGWSNGTSDFFSVVGNDTFEVLFSPQDIALISTATDIFAPPFDEASIISGNPPYDTTTTATGVFDNFVLTSGIIGQEGATGTYDLAEDLTFTFPDFVSEIPGELITVTWEEGTQFTFLYNTDNSVEFEVAAGQGNVIELTGIDVEDQVFLDESFEFSDGSTSEGGVYAAEVEFTESVPEPATILGLLTVGGLGLGLKRKKQA